MKLITDSKIILASESPRRKELFGRLGIPFEVQPSGITEELGGLFVEKIQGDYANVVGLPISRLYQHLLRLGVIKFSKEKSL